MKFNAIVGNPPYQEMDGGNSVSAKPVYNYFVDIAKKIKTRLLFYDNARPLVCRGKRA